MTATYSCHACHELWVGRRGHGVVDTCPECGEMDVEPLSVGEALPVGEAMLMATLQRSRPRREGGRPDDRAPGDDGRGRGHGGAGLPERSGRGQDPDDRGSAS